MAEQFSSAGFNKFCATKAGMVLGIVLAIAVGIVLFYAGAVTWCCGFGILLIAVLVFLVLKIFKVINNKVLIVTAVIFLLVATAFGALVVSKPMIQNNNYDTYNSAGFSEVQIVYNDDNTVTFSVKYAGDSDLKGVDVYFGEMSYAAYRNHNYYGYDNDEKYKHTMTLTDGRYSCSIDGVSTGKTYCFHFVGTRSDDSVFKSASGNDSGIYCSLISDGDLALFCLKWNGYYVALVTAMFLVIIIVTNWSKKRLDRKVKEMEAEGRITPNGYSRCKSCNGIILPGETHCRKCGAEVDVVGTAPVGKSNVTDTFACSECGKKVPADAKVCPFCGAKFDEDDE